MDLGISGRWAIVCAASKGLGLACARALAKEGVNLVINARGEEALAVAATELRTLGVEVRTVIGDISEASRVNWCWRRVRRSTFWSTMPAARHRVISATGSAKTG